MKADVLSIHCSLNDQTRHLIAERELAFMKPTAFVVNTARGAVIATSARIALTAIKGLPLENIVNGVSPKGGRRSLVTG